MTDDKRWMIRGVDKGLRKAIKDAASAEGVSIGNWVRRALQQALANAPDGPVTMADFNERIQNLDRRLALLEDARPSAPRRRMGRTGDRGGKATKEQKR